MIYVYAISSLSRDYIYVGLTENVQKRFERYNKGYECTTKPYRPFEILIVEQYPSRVIARKREKFLKSGLGKQYLRSLKV